MVYNWYLNKAVLGEKKKMCFQSACTSPFSPIYSDSKLTYSAEHSQTAENARLGQGPDLDPNPDPASSYSKLVTSLILGFHICEMGTLTVFISELFEHIYNPPPSFPDQ